MPPLINLVLRSVATDDAGSASGALVTAQQVGNALGVALVGAVFFGRLGGGTGPGPYGTAFATACAVQGALALLAAALVWRAGAHTTARAVACAPARHTSAAAISASAPCTAHAVANAKP